MTIGSRPALSGAVRSIWLTVADRSYDPFTGMEPATPKLDPPAPPQEGSPVQLRSPPAPLHGGPLALVRFMRRHRMLNHKYARLIAGLLRRRYLTRYGS